MVKAMTAKKSAVATKYLAEIIQEATSKELLRSPGWAGWAHIALEEQRQSSCLYLQRADEKSLLSDFEETFGKACRVYLSGQR